MTSFIESAESYVVPLLDQSLSLEELAALTKITIGKKTTLTHDFGETPPILLETGEGLPIKLVRFKGPIKMIDAKITIAAEFNYCLAYPIAALSFIAVHPNEQCGHESMIAVGGMDVEHFLALSGTSAERMAYRKDTSEKLGRHWRFMCMPRNLIGMLKARKPDEPSRTKYQHKTYRRAGEALKL